MLVMFFKKSYKLEKKHLQKKFTDLAAFDRQMLSPFRILRHNTPTLFFNNGAIVFLPNVKAYDDRSETLDNSADFSELGR